MLKSSVLSTCLIWLAIVSTASAQSNRPDIYLIRGGAGYWPGVHVLMNDMSECGFTPKTAFGSMYALNAAMIAADYQSGNCNGPLTIVGYSSGSDFACLLCKSLQSYGVPVPTLILLESTLGTPVPSNVELCINIYESRPATDWIPVFRGIPVYALSPDTELINIDVNASDDEMQALASYNHFTIASGSDMRAILRNILLQRRSQLDQQMQPQYGQQQIPLPTQQQPFIQPFQAKAQAQQSMQYRPASLQQEWQPVQQARAMTSPQAFPLPPMPLVIEPNQARAMSPYTSYRDAPVTRVR